MKSEFEQLEEMTDNELLAYRNILDGRHRIATDDPEKLERHSRMVDVILTDREVADWAEHGGRKLEVAA